MNVARASLAAAVLSCALAARAQTPTQAPAPAPAADPSAYVAPPAGDADASTNAAPPPPSGPITKEPPASAKSTTAAPPPPLPAATALSVRATLDKPEITLGEPFTLEIDVVHTPEDAYALPADLAGQLDKGKLKQAGDPVVRRERVAQGARTVITIPLVVLASMEPQIPDLALNVQGPEGPRALLVAGQPLKLKSLVKAEGAPNDEHAHHGPKPPVAVPERAYLWLWIVLGLGAVAAAIVLWRRYRKVRQVVIEAAPAEEPEVIALRRLDALRKRAPWLSGLSRAAIFERSEIVRSYLGGRLGFNAIDLTNDELLLELRARQPQGLDLHALSTRCAWEDMVKFAKMEPQPGECEAAIEEACLMVESLRPRLESTRSSPLAAPAAPAPEARA